MVSVLRKAFFSTQLLSRSCKSVFKNTVESGRRFKSHHFKVAALHELGQPLVIEEHDRKKLDKHDVRIKVECCSVNYSDLMICNGVYDVSPKVPFVPGYEMSGKILELGSKAAESGLKVDDRVVGLNKDLFSGFAEESVLLDKDLWNLPSKVNFDKAVALVDSYATAMIGLIRRANIKETDTVLITAGAGGLGLAAIDIAANVFKAKVIAVCETEEKAAILREKGAWAALTYKATETIKKCNEVTNGKGVRIVFDSLGSEFFDMVLKCVAPEGTVIVAGTASRLFPTIKTSGILPTSCSLIGVSLRNYRISNEHVYRDTIRDAIELYNEGLVHPVISKRFPLDKINDAMKYIMDGKAVGKVVITMKHED